MDEITGMTVCFIFSQLGIERNVFIQMTVIDLQIEDLTALNKLYSVIANDFPLRTEPGKDMFLCVWSSRSQIHSDNKKLMMQLNVKCDTSRLNQRHQRLPSRKKVLVRASLS